MNNISYWEQDTYFSDLSVVIVGSGIVGLNAAIQLKKRDPIARILILERGPLPSGASTKNAGFACFGSATELLADLRKYPEAEVFALVERRWKGLQRLRAIVGDAALSLEQWGGYEVFDQQEVFEHCADQLHYLNARLTEVIGPQVYAVTDDRIETFGFRNVKHLIFNAYEGQINSGTMMKALAEKARTMGIEILNGVNVRAIHDEGHQASIMLEGGYSIKTNRVLITTNGFAKELLPSLDVSPGRGQVLVTKPVEGLRLKGTFHYDEGYFYFRNVGNRVLLGGGRNLDFDAEATTAFGLTPLVQERLMALLHDMILPDHEVEIESRWSGIMGFGSQQAPIVRAVSERVFCAVKMQGMGVAIGSLVGEEAATMMLDL